MQDQLNSTLLKDELLSSTPTDIFSSRQTSIHDLEYLLNSEKSKTKMLSSLLRSKFFESFPKHENKQKREFNLLQLISRRFSGSIKSQLYDDLRNISTTEELFDKYASLLLDYNETYKHNNFLRSKLIEINQNTVDYKTLTRNREILYNILHLNDNLQSRNEQQKVPKLIANGLKWKALAFRNNDKIQTLNKEKTDLVLEMTKLKNKDIDGDNQKKTVDKNLEKRIIEHIKKVNDRVKNKCQEINISLKFVLNEQIQNLKQKIKNIPKQVKKN